MSERDFNPAITPRAGQDWQTLPAMLSASQAAAWLGLSKRQWLRARRSREIRTAQVFGTSGRYTRYWTIKLAGLVPAANCGQRTEDR